MLSTSELVNLIIRFACFLAGFWLLWKITYCSKNKESKSIPGFKKDKNALISIIIPARNEEHNLPKLLDSLKVQTLKVCEIIVVDDNSEDNTARIASDYGVKVIKIDEPPDGWIGKTWACHNGANAAKGDYLLFLDADTCLEEDAVERIFYCRKIQGGVISVQPYHKVKKFYEKFAIIFNIIAMAGINSFSPVSSRSKPYGAFGPCIFFSKEDYKKINGHESSKGKVLEDLSIGKKIIDSGIKLKNYGGKGLIDFRMYPKGFKSLIEGYSKGFLLGAKSTSILLLIITIAWISATFSAVYMPVFSIINRDYLIFFIYLFLYICYAAQIYWMGYRIGNFGIITAIFFPIYIVFFVLIFFYSIIITLFVKKVTWKGRKIKC
ncbi:MAG: glycosyltransferase family 2 protein [Actinomycetota bacterium]|jgi:4,4'-diaponeurosporenoate glycosyltransferase|nr:glycosyltransferase family 2 protein [Actinomycetota bacterium]